MKQIFSRKTTVLLIALLLTVSIASSLILIPNASAHTPPWTISTYAFIVVSPNPVGVSQTVYVNFWLDKVPPTSIGNWGMMWHNMKLNVTDPDGVTKDLGTFSSDAVGGAWTQFVPDKVGTYTFGFSFPGQVCQYENPYPYQLGFSTLQTHAFINDTFTGSSATTTLTVQETPVQSTVTNNPLPNEYWTRPVSSLNREWYSVSGNWLGLGAVQFGAGGMYGNTGNFNPYTEAPNSAHVLWTKPVAFGGQIGGEFGPDEIDLYGTGTAYETKFGSVIINGVLYYTQYPGAANDMGPLTAVDIRTGQTLWTVNASNPLKCGMIFNFINGDQYGGHAYLFTGYSSLGFISNTNPMKWSMYDAMTGQWILDIANATAGTLVRGAHGEVLSYTISNGVLTLWNSTKCINNAAAQLLTFSSYSANETWRPPQGATIDWKLGNQWTVPVATNISGGVITPPLSITRISDDVVLAVAMPGIGTGGVPGGSQFGWRIDAGYSAIDGQRLWGPINRTLTPWTNTPMGPAGDGVYTEYTCQTMTWVGYNILTGEKLWGPTQPYNSSWGYYDNGAKGVIGYGNLYAWSINGEVRAFNIKTGALNWSWSTGDAGTDTPYGVWPLGTWPMQHILADGKLYVRSGHDYTPPVFKGAKLYCINATNGQPIWDSLSFNIISCPSVADGVMLWLNGYDNQIYAYGKGPSKVTVTAPNVGITASTPITITGTVIDISAGTKQDGVATNFPSGLPCISDDSQSRFMEAVYQQQVMPTNLTGVPVALNVVDANGNYRTIGTTTSDADGFYSFVWTPDIEGKYTLYASFEGSESYWPSHAVTAFNVATASATATPMPTPAPSAADLYFLPAIAGLFVFIAIIGVATIMVLRKKP